MCLSSLIDVASGIKSKIDISQTIEVYKIKYYMEMCIIKSDNKSFIDKNLVFDHC